MYVSVHPTWTLVEPTHRRQRDAAAAAMRAPADASPGPAFGARMQELRIHGRVTFAQLAASLTDVTPPQLARWERGAETPSGEMAQRILYVLTPSSPAEDGEPDAAAAAPAAPDTPAAPAASARAVGKRPRGALTDDDDDDAW